MSQPENVREIVDVIPSPERSMFIPVMLFILAMLYVLSPVDPIPDVPVVGQIDDVFVAAIATLNLFQKWLKGTSAFLAGMLGLAKWLLVFIGIMACSVLGVAVLAFVKAVTG
ncbi:MAG: DUF1232 domain-containing protein [Thermodesulfobacteriota bacterium]